MSNARGTQRPDERESVPTEATDADVVRQIRAQTGSVRTVPEAVVSEALRKLDALAANGAPAPADVAAVIADALK